VVRSEFDDFYGATYATLVVQLAAYTGDRLEAQDVVQEAFARAWPRWHRLAYYDDPTGWVRRVAWNVATSRRRRVRATLATLLRMRAADVPEPDPAHVDLVRALAALPPRQRRAVILHHMAGMSVAEIAADCDVAVGTVKSWLHRARTTLARDLAEKSGRNNDRQSERPQRET
jgi:RNA polymerase sigma-70 factor, ECF subfamily